MSESELEKVERHVALGAEEIARQREVIRRLVEAGGQTEKELDILYALEELQRQNAAHRNRLLYFISL